MKYIRELASRARLQLSSVGFAVLIGCFCTQANAELDWFASSYHPRAIFAIVHCRYSGCSHIRSTIKIVIIFVFSNQGGVCVCVYRLACTGYQHRTASNHDP